MRRLVTGIAGLIASAALTMAAAAHDMNRPRHIAMTALGKDMKVIGQAVQAKSPISADVLAAAQRVAATAHRLLDLFPADSAGGESRAKPEIWQDWNGFIAASDRFAAAARSLAAAAHKNQPDAFADALTATAKTCKACHKTYRLPKKQ